jgi:hypothetical protein
MRILWAFFVLAFCCSLVMVAQDPAYIKTFGYGSIVASVNGIPDVNKYDPSQYDYRDKKFYIKRGANSTLDLRVFLPEGSTFGDLLDKLNKDASGNLKFKEYDFYSFRIWPSKDHGGSDLVTKQYPWPKSLKDEPLWTKAIDLYFQTNQEMRSWKTVRIGWEDDIKPDLQSIIRDYAPGIKLYVAFCVGFRYKTPGGQTEYKWNSVYEKWMPEISKGLLGFERQTPVASCTIELK